MRGGLSFLQRATRQNMMVFGHVMRAEGAGDRGDVGVRRGEEDERTAEGKVG